jgi:hypothetical protein
MSSKKKKIKTVKGVKTKTPLAYRGSVRHFRIPRGLPSPQEIRDELHGYRDVLHGWEDPPLEKGVMTLMETAEAYFSRTCGIEQEILEAIANGVIKPKSEYHTLRTQEIRSYKEMFKSATELGSRRITFENSQTQKEFRGLESI